jgi:hypothetical protein
MEAEQRKHPRIDGGKGRKCRSTGGGPIGGADRRAEVQSKGKSADQRPNRRGESAERKSEAVQQARASNRRRGRSSGGWMEAARRRIPGAAAAALFSSSLSLLSFPPNLSILRAAGMGRTHAGGIRARFPPRSLPATLFSVRVQPILRPCSVHLDESDAKATTRAREATP